MSRLTHAIIISLLIGMLGVIASFICIPCGLEEKIGLDLLFRLRSSSKPPSDVIIVSLDKASADNLNLPRDTEEWPRSLHARLIENLTKRGPAVIAFDMLFLKPSDIEKDDNSFAHAISNSGNVVLCQYLEKKTEGDSVTNPIPCLEQSALALAPFPLPSDPEKLSQYWVFKPEAGDIPTLPVVAFQIFAFEVYDEFIRLMETVSPPQAEKLFPDKDAIIRNRSVEENILNLRNHFSENPLIGEKIIEEIDNPKYLSFDPKKKRILKSLIEVYQSPTSRYLNFYGPPGTIETVPYYQILQSNEESAVKERQLDLNGKAVFVGLSERMRPELKDDGFPTVFSESGVHISGVEIAATVFANLLEDKPIKPAVFPVYYATIFLWGVLLGILCLFTPPAISAISLIGLSALYLGVVFFQFDKTGSWYPITIPLFFQAPTAYFGTLLWKFFKVNKERQNIREAFKKYLPENVVEQLARNLGDIQTDTQIVYGTCLFTEGEQYTSLSENMNPKELSIFMNSYYEAVFEPIRRYGGIVSDIKGDSMLSIWATAQPDAAPRRKACTAALDISKAVEQFKQNADTLHLPTRIGLHSGYISIGSVGAINHYEYRPVGDIVNTASRIENLNKYLGTRILISKQVLHQIDSFLTRKIGEFILKGKSKPVVIYELISRKEESSEQQKELCAIFTEGLTAYYRQSWEDAINAFRTSVQTYKQDGPSIFYLARSEEYKANPPGENWTGIIRLDNK
jgi:adenylate cyclase